MFFKASKSLLGMLASRKKTGLVSLPVLFGGIVLGYHIFLAWLLSGFVVAKCFGGRATGTKGRMPSIAFALKKRRVHLHHWLICSVTMGLAAWTGTWFLPWDSFYGFLGGMTLQGIYCYTDWHRVLILRG
jgi:hypothetical protein